ncbi:hypothetical protein K2173_023783 [Erythroxylum novogranatense]|uniref:Leucine-rich repeat-containing N-terminal plant-type domain-containing protein n=1 Tax=Erythroxylum novogranatense TaxID=1862640 RepID=A0AAV8TI51_9ROSI|nr:hypothetical protein K2173_023783 [Erythroxylum novogranatense]
MVLYHFHATYNALLHFKRTPSVTSFASSGCDRHSSPKTESWKNGVNCCYWDGVTCDKLTGHVIGLDLSCSGLSGTLDSNNSLFLLSHVQRLNLAFNNFSHSSISSKFGQLTSLAYLNLSYSSFAGLIPDIFGDLHRLTYLDLSSNKFYGQIPSSIFNLAKISHLRISSNRLVGSLPDEVSGLSVPAIIDLSDNLLNGTLPSWLFAKPSLLSLNLSSNQLTGELPEFQSKSLEYINLQKNQIHGAIPSSIFELVNITYIDFSYNNLNGSLELDMFSNLRKLKVLEVSRNGLSMKIDSHGNVTWPRLLSLGLSSCNVTTFPAFLRTQNDLRHLNLSHNRIPGEVPSWLWIMGRHSLQNLDLAHNLLTAVKPLPMDSLFFLDLYNNSIRGSLPIPPQSTKYFYISNNYLTGEVPSSICQITSLQILDLSNNSFSGTIPRCLLNFTTQLSVLNLRMNRFHGVIPDTFVRGISLRSLDMNGNQLEGPLPQSLINCKMLAVIDLGNNKITDTFPTWLGALQDLQVLFLRSNRLHGHIGDPQSRVSFPRLRMLDISHNAFTGPLPSRHFGNFKAMMNVGEENTGLRYMESPFYQDSMVVTMKGLEVRLVRVLTIFTALDFSNNTFQGEIPQLLGNLKSLRVLNLSRNSLSGSIPSSIANMSVLESLDLSSNKLAGEIPRQLTGMTSLSFINLSYNMLEGPIPQGNQFNTFSNNSYVGNLGLCGDPLSRKCGSDEAPQLPESFFQEEDDSEIGFNLKASLIGYGCGIIIGLSTGYLVFETGKPWWLVNRVEEKWGNKLKRIIQRHQRRKNP